LPGDLIWIHDYHLIPLGRFLRELGVINRIGFFLHIPFVPTSVLEALPVATELLGDLCNYDVVGFQTHEFARNFRVSAERLLNAQAARPPVSAGCRFGEAVADPIGVEPVSIERSAIRTIDSPDTKRLISSLVGRALVIGVDRLDYSKGLPNRFEAIGR